MTLYIYILGVFTKKPYSKPLERNVNKLIEKSRECHNHKPQPTPDTKRKRKRTKTNKQTNAQEGHRPAPSSPSEVITMLKCMTKHEDKEYGKTPKHEAPVSRNHKATQNKNNAGNTALERPVE